MKTEALKNQVLSTISSYEDDILDFTQRLMEVGTENPPGRMYRECVGIIREKLLELGLECEVQDVPVTNSNGTAGEYPRSCILSHYGKGKRTVYFHGHYDVVPASKEGQFQPYIEGGSLFGRGSSDMKSGLAAMIYAVNAIRACDVSLGGRIGLVIVPDEETGGQLGAGYLAEMGALGKDGIAMILGEPTSGVVWNANRGAISLRITIKGRPAHVGLQYQGDNAFEKMLVVADALGDLKKEVESRRTHYNIHPDAARNSILLIGGRCEGGSNFNVVPGECIFTIDRRVNPEEDLEVEKRRVFDVLESVKRRGIDLDVEVIQEGQSSGVPEEHPVCEALAGNIEAVKGKRPAFELCPGLLENRFYAGVGVPALAYGPGLLAVSHGPNEFVKIEEIYKCTAVYALTALDLLSD